MRPKVGLRVLQDVIATDEGDSSGHHADRRRYYAASWSSGPMLPVGLVTKVTDEHIEIRWGKDDRPEKRPVNDDGTFGLRVLDDSTSSSNSTAEKGGNSRNKCWICSTVPIKGFSWACQSCPQCVLCTRCYMTNGHPQMGHWFLRCGGEFPQGDPMPMRNANHRKKVLFFDRTTMEVLLDHLPVLSICHEPGSTNSSCQSAPDGTPAIVTADLLGLESSFQGDRDSVDTEMPTEGTCHNRMTTLASAPGSSSAASASVVASSSSKGNQLLRPVLPPRPNSFQRSLSASGTEANATLGANDDEISSGGESSAPSGSTTPRRARSFGTYATSSAAAAAAAIVLSQTSAAEEALTCPVCFEPYQLENDEISHGHLLPTLGQQRPSSQEKKVPLVLTSCGHTLCHGCACQMHARQPDKVIHCPVCRTETGVNSAEELHRNFSLMNILESRRTQLRQLLQQDSLGCEFSGLPRAASTSCLTPDSSTSPSDQGQSFSCAEMAAATAAGSTANAAALSSMVPALVAQLAAATSGPKAFRGLCHSHGRNLSLWCAVCCDILCMGCVDAHSGHEKLTAEELPGFLEDRMACLTPQIADGVENLNAATTRLLTTADKMIRELKDVKHHSRDETKDAADRKRVSEEYRKSLSALDLEDMINAWRRADSLVVEIRAKTFQAEQLKKELDKDLLAWLRKKPKFLVSRNDPNRTSSPSSSDARRSNDPSRQRSTPSSPVVFGFGGTNFNNRRKTSKPGQQQGASTSAGHQHTDQAQTASAAQPKSTATAGASGATHKTWGDKPKVPAAKILGRFFTGGPKGF